MAKLILCKCDVYIKCIRVFSILFRCILYLSRETWMEIQRETDRDFRVGYMQIIKYFGETSNLFEGHFHINKKKNEKFNNNQVIKKYLKNVYNIACTIPRGYY